MVVKKRYSKLATSFSVADGRRRSMHPSSRSTDSHLLHMNMNLNGVNRHQVSEQSNSSGGQEGGTGTLPGPVHFSTCTFTFLCRHPIRPSIHTSWGQGGWIPIKSITAESDMSPQAGTIIQKPTTNVSQIQNAT